MIQKWVIPNEGWYLRSTQDGLEFIGSERNISLEFPDLEDYRERIAAMLSGRQIVSQDPDDESIREVIQDLTAKGILQTRELKPQEVGSLSEAEQHLWKVRSAFVGSHGPVHTAYRLDPLQSNFPLLSYHALTAKYISSGENEEEWAGGIDQDPILAELKAVMETLERWSSGIIPEAELRECSAKQLGESAFDPRRVIAYSKRQYRRKYFPLTPFANERKYRWKSVTTFPEGKTGYLPIECLYYPIPLKRVSNPYTFANSSGVAAGFSFEEAVLRGVYEAMERDAFMVTWINRQSMPRIQIDTLPEEERFRVRNIEELGYKLHLVNLTLDLAPVVLAVAVHETEKPALTLGAASNLNFLDAIKKALSEVEYQLYWTLRHPDHIRTIKNQKEVTNVLDHMGLFSSQKHLSKAQFLWEGPEVLCPSLDGDNPDELGRLLQTLEAFGEKLVVADLTPPLLKEFGVYVIRSIPIGLVPISFGYGMEPLGSPRLSKVDLPGNPWPRQKPFTHPFA